MITDDEKNARIAALTDARQREEIAALKARIAELEGEISLRDRTALERADRIAGLEKLDREAATHVESLICLRTDFTGEPPHVGWKGLGLALKEHLDKQDARIAELEKNQVPEGWVAVPLEPTWEMQIVGRDSIINDDDPVDGVMSDYISIDNATDCYRAMLAARGK